LSLNEKFLAFPSKQPDYRVNHHHRDFLMNLNLGANLVKAALRKAWDAKTLLNHPPSEKITALPRDKYSARACNCKFQP